MLRFLVPDYSRAGAGIDRNAPKKEGIPLFVETFCREFTTLLKLNVIFLISCIPIVTIGPAIGALTSVTLKMIKDEPVDLYYDFKEGFKKNWKQSLIFGILGVLIFLIIACALLYYIQLEGIAYYLMMFIIGATGIVAAMIYLYIYPMAVGVNLNIKAIIKNSFILSTMSIKNSFIALVICGVVTYISLVIRIMTIPIIFIFFNFAFCSFIGSFCAWSSIEKSIIK